MGRYAFFNTDLEYKFGFGVQPSEDIFHFGGRNLIIWNKEEAPEIFRRLEGLATEYNFILPVFESYSNDLDGTHNLRNTIDDMKTKHYRELYLFKLGCLIYHQLMYMDVLECDFEY